MRRGVIVIGLLLVVGTVFAGGRSEVPTAVKQVQTRAQSGECDSDCDGEPDRVRLQEPLKDGSCREGLIVGLADEDSNNGKGDQLRTRDGDHDGEPDVDQTRDRIRLSNPQL